MLNWKYFLKYIESEYGRNKKELYQSKENNLP